MIELVHLVKRFGDLAAVSDINLTVPRGEFFAVLGPNAAGKTTTIRILAGLIKPTSGSASLVGLDPHHSRVLKDVLKEQSRRGVTIFISTHQLSVAEEMADRIGIIHQGRLVAVGTREDLRRQSGVSGALEQTFLALTAQEANFAEQSAGAAR